ncbi:50S ribosomal protein L6 [bacterium]|nr:50S ribosomal protein L6 [bacterium]
MAKITNKPIMIPSGVTASVENGEVTIKGAKGQLKVQLLPNIDVEIDGDKLIVHQGSQEKQTKAFVGLIKALVRNAIAGVTTGFSKTLKLVGTGYRVQAQGKGISLAVGFSHTVEFMPPEGVELKVEGQDTIIVSGFDKQQVGQVAANIRKVRPPEPYKGKGIRYVDEVVRRKQGKTAAK